MKSIEIGICADCGFRQMLYERQPTDKLRGRVDVSGNKKCMTCIATARAAVKKSQIEKSSRFHYVGEMEFVGSDCKGLPAQTPIDRAAGDEEKDVEHIDGSRIAEIMNSLVDVLDEKNASPSEAAVVLAQMLTVIGDTNPELVKTKTKTEKIDGRINAQSPGTEVH